MAGDTGPTTEDVNYLNRVLSPGGVGGGEDDGANSYNQAIGDALRAGGGQQTMPDYSAMRDQIAQMMASRGGYGGGGGGDPYAAYRTAMASRQPQADPYAALRASMASRAAQPQADPYAAYRAAMASRAQPAAAGANPYAAMLADNWKRIAEAQAYQEANPYDQYFAPRGPLSGSEGGAGWMDALQPWQGGSTGVSGSGSGMNTSGFIGGGGKTRADPSYWDWTPGTGWGTNQNAQVLWEQLQQFNPALYVQYGGDAGMAAGIAGGFGPGGDGGGGPGGVGGGGGGPSGGPSGGGGGPSGGPSGGGAASAGFGQGATGFNGYGAPADSGIAGGFSGQGYGAGYGGVGFGSGFGSMGTGSVGAPGQGVAGGFGESAFGGGIGIGGLGAAGSGFGDSGQGYGSPW